MSDDPTAPAVNGLDRTNTERLALELNEELVKLAGKLTTKNLELEQVRSRLETIVGQRTADLERSNRTFRHILFAMDSAGISILWADM